MKFIDFDEVKKLKSVIIKLQKSSRNEAVDFIKNDGFNFHRLFLHSGFIFVFQPCELNKILSGMDTDIDRDTKIKEDLDLLIFLISREKDYEEQITHLINTTKESEDEGAKPVKAGDTGVAGAPIGKHPTGLLANSRKRNIESLCNKRKTRTGRVL
ncbi:hypothetical protein [Cohnella zeiphila]|uniref:Uncharacterized protein n=1 Tax=Cohnella zeiphila TaxID=2761120 RepID=A0A7X0VX98_9BACL|nr:hypothetical protein [Cohnella zeiphila]MBB6734049.1 hypothetical protein [Cohnella zeiphila]